MSKAVAFAHHRRYLNFPPLTSVRSIWTRHTSATLPKSRSVSTVFLDIAVRQMTLIHLQLYFPLHFHPVYLSLAMFMHQRYPLHLLNAQNDMSRTAAHPSAHVNPRVPPRNHHLSTNKTRQSLLPSTIPQVIPNPTLLSCTIHIILHMACLATTKCLVTP